MTDSRLTEQELQDIRERYLIWSFEHDAWWGPNHRGYVAAHMLYFAGRYSRDEAHRIVTEANRGRRMPEDPNEIAVRLTGMPEIEERDAELSRLRSERVTLAKAVFPVYDPGGQDVSNAIQLASQVLTEEETGR